MNTFPAIADPLQRQEPQAGGLTPRILTVLLGDDELP